MQIICTCFGYTSVRACGLVESTLSADFRERRDVWVDILVV